MKTILIVDDDDAFREMLRTVLESRGFRVLTAANTGGGLEIAATQALDAVLTDYQMPHRDGLTLCRALQDRKQLPVWIMTGCLTLTTNEATAAGAQDVFRKPFSPIEVGHAVERHLESTIQRLRR